jgi:hypothetical protein
MFILQEGVYSEGEKCETLALVQALRPPTVSNNVLDAHVQATFDQYDSVRAHNEYVTRCGRKRLEVERCRRSIVAERLKEYNDNRTTERLQQRLPPLPWVHSANEAAKVFENSCLARGHRL